MGRKHGHRGFTEEAKARAARARRRDEREELSRALADALEPGTVEREPAPGELRLAGGPEEGAYASPQSSPEQSLLTKAAPAATRNRASRAPRPPCIDNEDSSPQVRSIGRAIFVVTGHPLSCLTGTCPISANLARISVVGKND